MATPAKLSPLDDDQTRRPKHDQASVLVCLRSFAAQLLFGPEPVFGRIAVLVAAFSPKPVRQTRDVLVRNHPWLIDRGYFRFSLLCDSLAWFCGCFCFLFFLCHKNLLTYENWLQSEP